MIRSGANIMFALCSHNVTMTMIRNVKHERFARYIAKGLTISESYRRAGYRPSCSNASVLYNSNSRSSQRIRQRVEILVNDASKLDAQDILNRVLGVAELSQESGQFATALKAFELLGKEKGLWRDRRENITLNLNGMTWEQTTNYLTDKYGERAASLIEWLKCNYSDNNTTVNNTPIQPVRLVGANMQQAITDDESPDGA